MFGQVRFQRYVTRPRSLFRLMLLLPCLAVASLRKEDLSERPLFSSNPCHSNLSLALHSPYSPQATSGGACFSLGISSPTSRRPCLLSSPSTTTGRWTAISIARCSTLNHPGTQDRENRKGCVRIMQVVLEMISGSRGLKPSTRFLFPSTGLTSGSSFLSHFRRAFGRYFEDVFAATFNSLPRSGYLLDSCTHHCGGWDFIKSDDGLTQHEAFDRVSD